MTMTKPTSEQVTFTAAGSGASQRTVLDKLRDVVSVKDFGAVGDGVTDDTTAFTNAVTAAGTKNVFVPGGSYKITGTVTGSFYSDSTVTIVTGTVNTISRIGSVLSTTGDVTLTNGNVIIGTAGKGIDFSATANSSGTMTSELLNDYEEGTWTATVAFGGASVGVTYLANTCRYTKIGRVVTVGGYFALSSKGSSTGNATIEGLPFTSHAFAQAYVAGSLDSGAISFSGQLFMNNILGTTSLQFVESTIGGVRTPVTNADFTNASLAIFSITYTI